MLQQARSILFALYLPLLTLLMGVGCAPVLLFSRAHALACVKAYARLVLAGERWICGTKYQLRGHQHLPDGAAIIAAKHQSMWETVALIPALSKPVYILKQELFAVPILGWWCRAIGFIGIDRKGGAQALRDMTTRAQKAIADGAQIVIFPEGTRAAPGQTGRYQPGVAGLYASLRVNCVPFAHNAGHYWCHPGITHHAGMIKAEFLPPIAPGLKRKAFMGEIEQAIETRTSELAPTPQTPGLSQVKMV